jgi:hypothetical protein
MFAAAANARRTLVITIIELASASLWRKTGVKPLNNLAFAFFKVSAVAHLAVVGTPPSTRLVPTAACSNGTEEWCEVMSKKSKKPECDPIIAADSNSPSGTQIRNRKKANAAIPREVIAGALLTLEADLRDTLFFACLNT